MTDWVILVESASDISQAETPHKVLRVSDYISKPALFAGRRPYILNLSRSYSYQSEGSRNPKYRDMSGWRGKCRTGSEPLPWKWSSTTVRRAAFRGYAWYRRTS